MHEPVNGLSAEVLSFILRKLDSDAVYLSLNDAPSVGLYGFRGGGSIVCRWI